MKRKHLLLLTILAAASALGVAGCKPTGDAAEDKIVTEVAVQVGKVTRADLRRRVEVFGVVEPEPAKAGHPGGGAKLAAPAAGVVLAVAASEGQSVKAGDLIVRLDDRLALAQVEKARHALEFAEQQMARQKKLKEVEGNPQIKARIPLGRLAEPGDVADAVAFLMSGQARFITGHSLYTDGGWLAYGYF